MSTLHYNLRITDPEFTTRLENIAVDYDRRVTIQRTLKEIDGLVDIDLTDVETMSVLYIHTTGTIVVTITGGSTLDVDAELFTTHGLSVTGIQRTGADVDVEIYAYGSAPA